MSIESILHRLGKEIYCCNGFCERCPKGAKCAAGKILHSVAELVEYGYCPDCAVELVGDACPKCEMKFK